MLVGRARVRARSIALVCSDAAQGGSMTLRDLSSLLALIVGMLLVMTV